MDSAKPPLAVRGLYGGSYRQRHRHSTEEVHQGVGPRGSDPARPSVFHWYVLVRAAVCRQMAEQAIGRLMGGLVAGPNLNPSDKSAIALIEGFFKQYPSSQPSTVVTRYSLIDPATG
jgi:hypothetical protein